MIHHPTRLQAVREALVLAVVIAAVAAAVVFIRQRPADIDELTISIEALRSQVAELALMNDQAGDKLPPRFVTAQATQLANAVDKTRDELQQMHPERELQPVQQEGLAHARRLLDAVEAMRRSGRSLPPASTAQLQAESRQLKAREEDLRR